MAPSLGAADISALQKVVAALREDSAVLDAPELFFFKHLLLDWNAQIPAVRASRPPPPCARRVNSVGARWVLRRAIEASRPATRRTPPPNTLFRSFG